MGTTSTPVLGLIKPDGNEPGSNFPAQHGSNMDKLDRVGTVIPANNELVSSTLRPTKEDDATNASITSTSYVGVNDGAEVFVAPPSGAVLLLFHTHLQVAVTANVTRSAFGSIEVRSGGTPGGGSVVSPYAFADSDSIRIGVGPTSSDIVSLEAGTFRLITGLTPGNTYHARFGYRLDTGTSVTASAARRRIVAMPCL